MTHEVTNGSDLMFFVKNGSGYTSIAYATSCSIDIATETTETTSKDHTGGWSTAIVKKLSWTGSSDNLYADEQANGYDLMFKMLTDKQPIEIYFCTKTDSAMAADSWVKGAGGYKGKALITGLSATAGDGENATFNVSFTGYGALEPVATA